MPKIAKVAKKYVIAMILTWYDKFAQTFIETGVIHISKVIWIIFTA